MRSSGLALLVSATVLGACAGGEKSTPKPEGTTATPGVAPSAPAPGASTGAPMTGTMTNVNMVGDAKGYHFEPNVITIKTGDAITFHTVSGVPHNIGFDPTTVPVDAQAQLAANMPGEHTMGALEGPMLLLVGDTYTVSFAKIKPGTYGFHCTPHLALNMKGTVTVQ